MTMHETAGRKTPKLRHLVLGALVAAGLATAALTTGSASAVTQAAPKNTTEPRVSGSPAAGSTLTATSGDWSGSSPINYAYQWVRCPSSGGKSDGSDCASISGATTAGYVVGSADVGKRLRVRVTASNTDGSATAASNATGSVTGSGGGRPRNTKAPSISGNLSAGSTLHGDPGTWTGAQPITFSYQWQRCDTSGNNCIVLGGQASDAYTLRDGDIGHTLRFNVGARNTSGHRSSLSAATGVIPAGPVVAGGGGGGGSRRSDQAAERRGLDSGDERSCVGAADRRPRRLLAEPGPFELRSDRDQRQGEGLARVRRQGRVRLRPVDTARDLHTERAADGDGRNGDIHRQPNSSFPIRTGYSVQFFVKAHRQGDNPLGGIAGYRLVQVATAS